jgi:formiminoglutamase
VSIISDRWVPPSSPRDIPHLQEVEVQRVSHWNDPYELRVDNWIEPWDFGSDLDVGLITVPSSKTSIKHNGAFAAPNALRAARYLHTTYTPDYDVDLASLKVREVGDVAVPVLDLREGMVHIQDSLRGCFSQPENFFPIVIGGDHAVTAPSVRA